MMSAEARFQLVAQQIFNLLDCGSVHLLLGCPEPELRHPLLNPFSIIGYCSAGGSGSPGSIDLLKHERVRALCDGAIQSGQVQSIDQFHMFADVPHIPGGSEIQSIAVAPLERPTGILGLLLLTDPLPDAFCSGEHLLLRRYLPQAVQSLERDLRDMSVVSSHPNFDCKGEGASRQVGSGARTLEQEAKGARELVQVDQQLKELDRLKNEFISMVSHELRTPLTAIKGYAVLLQAYGVADRPHESGMGEMSPARQREYLDLIMEQTSHLEVLISDLLDISRIHAGRLSLRCSRVNVASLCSRVVQFVQERAEQQYPGRYKISYNLPPDLPLTWVDADRLQQVLNNLLENAVKYSPEGGPIEVLASACSAMVQPSIGELLSASPDVSSASETLMVYITVRDQGIGIPHDQQIHLFKPFSRLEHSLAHEVPGAGLGLYITRKLVEAMGGSIIFSSSEGVGTSVTFTLPVKPPDNAPVTGYVPMTTLSARY